MFHALFRRAFAAHTSVFACFLVLAVCCAVAQPALAGPMSTGDRSPVVVSVRGWNPEKDMAESVDWQVPVGDDLNFSLRNAKWSGEDWSLDDLSVSGNVDPFTSLNFAVTNNAAVTMLFTVSVTLPIVPVGPLTLHGGSTGGTLTDANNNGIATVATPAGIPYYRGQIDGATVLSIYPDPYSLSVPFAGATVNVPALNPGLPGPTILSGPALATIGIINQFTLTPGDQFSGNSFFVVEPVPEPSTIALAALGLVMLALRRR